MKILSFRVEYPSIGSGRYKNQLVSINNLNKINHFQLSKIKNKFKQDVKEWLVPEGIGEPIRDGVLIRTSIIRHNKRKFDAINTAVVVKWLEDILVESRIIEDDKDNEIHHINTQYHTGLVQTMIQFEVYTKEDN